MDLDYISGMLADSFHHFLQILERLLTRFPAHLLDIERQTHCGLLLDQETVRHTRSVMNTLDREAADLAGNGLCLDRPAFLSVLRGKALTGK